MNIEKVCSKCGEPKSLEEFHHDKRGKHSEFKDCWSLDNLQPLFAIDNLRKGAQKSYES